MVANKNEAIVYSMILLAGFWIVAVWSNLLIGYIMAGIVSACLAGAWLHDRPMA